MTCLRREPAYDPGACNSLSLMDHEGNGSRRIICLQDREMNSCKSCDKKKEMKVYGTMVLQVNL
jgi:hypothetical protein